MCKRFLAISSLITIGFALSPMAAVRGSQQEVETLPLYSSHATIKNHYIDKPLSLILVQDFENDNSQLVGNIFDDIIPNVNVASTRFHVDNNLPFPIRVRADRDDGRDDIVQTLLPGESFQGLINRNAGVRIFVYGPEDCGDAEIMPSSFARVNTTETFRIRSDGIERIVAKAVDPWSRVAGAAITGIALYYAPEYGPQILREIGVNEAELAACITDFASTGCATGIVSYAQNLHTAYGDGSVATNECLQTAQSRAQQRTDSNLSSQVVPTGLRTLRLQRDNRHLQGHEVNGNLTGDVVLFDHGQNPLSHAVWEIESVGNGYYTLRNQRDNRHLQGHEVNGNLTGDVVLFDHGQNSLSHAVWEIESVGNGYYTLRNQRDNRHLQGHEVNGNLTGDVVLFDHGQNPPSHAIWKIE